ncbi:MAG: histidine triad nucleotide-binding protein [Alphaproteobacteria bacterium]|nr:histidine triad nucleotide-binding protein [Alphaproteobacteria bacterium]
MTEAAATKTYDPNNIFARILRAEIPCNKVFEDDHVLAFRDIQPQAPVHVLVIPKGAYVDMDDFTARASADEIAALFRVLGQIARSEGLAESGYRVLSNCGLNGGQEVPHLHLHLVGGRKLGRMLAAD